MNERPARARGLKKVGDEISAQYQVVIFFRDKVAHLAEGIVLRATEYPGVGSGGAIVLPGRAFYGENIPSLRSVIINKIHAAAPAFILFKESMSCIGLFVQYLHVTAHSFFIQARNAHHQP